MANSAQRETQHALLVVFGQFAREIGLISGIQGAKLDQKTVAGHTSAKVILNSKGMLLRFSPASPLAGKSLQFRTAISPDRTN